jgi:hypothetical protein
MDKLAISNEMLQFDRKNRDFYDDLTEDEKKKFSPFLMIRWGATVEGDADLQAYYLISANERINKHFFDISTTQHKKLHWLLATTVSPGLGKQLAGNKKENTTKASRFLREIYPTAKSDEIQLMVELNSADDLKQLARAHGWDDKRIKSDL